MSTIPIINAQLEDLNETEMQRNYILNRIAGKLGAYESPASWAEIQSLVRTGLIGMYVAPGDQMNVDMNEMVTASTSGTGVTAASVNTDTFLTVAGTEKTEYVFSFDGSNWNYGGQTVSLSTYGITPTGTAAEGDSITVHRTATAYAFDVEGIDEECPANPQYSHVLSLVMHPVFSLLAFDPAQYLYAVTAEQWPNGLPAGTYTITLDHGAYDGGTGQDGTYQITTTQVIPVGGGIRHSSIGASQAGGYTKAQITAGTWTTYEADSITVLESGLATVESDTGTSLGTATCKDPQYKAGDAINFTQRQAYGSGRWSTSYLRQVLNSDDAELAWEPATKWSRNLSIKPEGFLRSLDPALRAVLGKTRTRYALSIADGYGYEDVEDTVTLDTMLDVFGSKNNSISEGPVDSTGTVTRETAMSLWQGSQNDDRIKYQGTTARHWWLGSTNPSHANVERLVDASGALSSDYASGSHGVVPRLQII